MGTDPSVGTDLSVGTDPEGDPKNRTGTDPEGRQRGQTPREPMGTDPYVSPVIGGIMKKYIMALDAGTTSNRCIIFDKSGNIISLAQKEFTQYYPQAGWVEHDPEEIWETQLLVIKKALTSARISPCEISALGITNQRETTIVWEKSTGKPVYNAIVWQCRRTSAYCDTLRDKGLSPVIQKKTGLVVDAYFSGTKIKWILDNVEGCREKADKGELLFGTVETWLIWKLTRGKVHATDYTNASRTMLFNINTLNWDKDMLNEFGIPETMLPEPMESSGFFGCTDPDLLGESIDICGAAGDQQSALFGQACFSEGMVKNTYGTGCFMLMNTGNKPVESKNGLITTIAWGINKKVTYALEGSVFVAGAVIQWLRDELKMLDNAADSEYIASQVDDTAGVYIVPAFTGLGAPYWDQYARGTIVGLTRGVNKSHIVRAALESMAYQTVDVLSAMELDSGISIEKLMVDGGACANNLLMQFQADIINAPVERPVCVESTALGAAYLAGLHSRFWSSIDDIYANRSVQRLFIPSMQDDIRKEKIIGWKSAVKKAIVT